MLSSVDDFRTVLDPRTVLCHITQCDSADVHRAPVHSILLLNSFNYRAATLCYCSTVTIHDAGVLYQMKSISPSLTINIDVSR